jgi:hypothetical protein
MYRQVTIYGIFNSKGADASKIAYADVVKAWDDYLARYNHGRGVVLIGHSQGAFILKRLLARQIETKAAVRDRVVSAILLGGNVTVPNGKDVGGDLQRVPACHTDRDVGCVMAYSSFDHPPPIKSLFGRSRRAGYHVLCTNPAALGGGSAPLDAYFPAHQLGGVINFTSNPLASTAWVRYPDLLTGECKSEGGADVLQVTDVRKSPDERLVLRDSLGPTWGLHIYDANVALGNLVDVVKSEAAAYASKG